MPLFNTLRHLRNLTLREKPSAALTARPSDDPMDPDRVVDRPVGGLRGGRDCDASRTRQPAPGGPRVTLAN